MWSFNINIDFLETETFFQGICISPMASCRIFKHPGNFALRMETEEATGFMVDWFSDWCHKKKNHYRENVWFKEFLDAKTTSVCFPSFSRNLVRFL